MPDLRTSTIVGEDVDLAYAAEVVVRGASFRCEPGTVTGLLGPNGSGKSTLLHAIAGLTPVRSGRLEVLGAAPGRSRRRLAYVLQSTRVSEHLPITVREVVAIGRLPVHGLFRRATATDRAAVDRSLDRLGIAELAGERLDELSGGQRQRVFVAQGLAQEADVLLLDEPVTGLDLVARDTIVRVVAEEAAAGRTVLITTHDLSEATACDHLLLLAGRVVAAGSPDDVLQPEHLTAAYGARLFTYDDGFLLVDDGHHHHEGDDHTDHEH